MTRGGSCCDRSSVSASGASTRMMGLKSARMEVGRLSSFVGLRSVGGVLIDDVRKVVVGSGGVGIGGALLLNE